jgi:hypothetical protein
MSKGIDNKPRPLGEVARRAVTERGNHHLTAENKISYIIFVGAFTERPYDIDFSAKPALRKIALCTLFIFLHFLLALPN